MIDGLKWSSAGTNGSGGVSDIDQRDRRELLGRRRGERRRGRAGRRGSAGRNSAPPKVIPTGYEPELEAGHDAEVAAAAADRPEQVRVAPSLAVTIRPSAVTTSTETRLSIVRPYLRTSQPIPPPSVRPAIPTLPGVAERRREPVGRGRGRVLAGGQAGLGPGEAPLGVDVEALHRRRSRTMPPSVALCRRCCGRRREPRARGRCPRRT